MVPCMVPAEWASTFDRLIGIDYRLYDGKTVGYGRLAKMAMAMAMALLRRGGGDGCR